MGRERRIAPPLLCLRDARHRRWPVSVASDPPQGLYPQYIDPSGFFVNRAAWQRAYHARDAVGDCRQPDCAGRMIPTPTHSVGKVDWFGAECDGVDDRDEPYRHEIAAPDGRVVKGSALHSEMPTGWWDRRNEHLAKLKSGGTA